MSIFRNSWIKHLLTRICKFLTNTFTVIYSLTLPLVKIFAGLLALEVFYHVAHFTRFYLCHLKNYFLFLSITLMGTHFTLKGFGSFAGQGVRKDVS